MTTYYVYIMGNNRPTLYVGVTNNLIRRVYEHKMGFVEGFTKRYSLHKLLYFEQTNEANIALQREKQLKHWNRDWKIQLIKTINPLFVELYNQIIEDSQSS